MKLLTCKIEVDVVLLYIEESVANSTIHKRKLCDFVRWPWHSNNNKYIKEDVLL
jgi:hypothetical protein